MTAPISSYHAHIYYDVAATRSIAETIRTQIAERFPVRLGRWHDELVGPHLQPMYQVAFLPQVFPMFVPWLMLHRAGLTVLIHPNTGAPRADHLVHSAWLGAVLPLKAEVLPEREDVAMMETGPNTFPRDA
jgi:aromatic ring-cleaving dioxygenase